MDLNIGYFFIIHGLLLIGQFVLSMTVLICVGVVNERIAADGAVLFTSIGCMVTCFVLILINLLNIPSNASNVPWMLIRFVISAFWSIFYFISLWICVAGAAQRYYSKDVSSYTAASVFSALALIICSWDAIINFFKLRRGPSTENPT